MEKKANPHPVNGTVRIEEIVVGRLVELDVIRTPRVEYEGGAPVAARSLIPLKGSLVGREGAPAFEEGDPARPILMGVLERPGRPEPKDLDVRVDGEAVTIEGRRELVLKCDKTSITLTRTGRVILRGAHVSSRSTGVNRIKGRSVQIN